ncbi:MAG: FtsX-like permease family protein [Bacteroidia bacterium]|nr:FtsX-like permease family protein [Bacteroidia bacterium]
MRDIYLYHQLDGRVKAYGAIQNVYIFSAIAIFVLILALFNYINLASARASLRAREVGVRKVMGARRAQLFGQFLGESWLLTFLATILGLVLLEMALPYLNALADKNLSWYSLLTPANGMWVILVICILALLAGSYPALVLSAFPPTLVLKKMTAAPSKGINLRRTLVVIQFTVSIVMMIATGAVLQQMQYIRNKNLGYNRQQVLTLSFPKDTPPNLKETFKKQLQNLASVRSASRCGLFPGEGTFRNKLVESYVPKGKDIGFEYVTVDQNFLNTFEIKLTEGKNFDASSVAEKPEFIINEAMCAHLEWPKEEAVGKNLAYYTYEYLPSGEYREVASKS